MMITLDRLALEGEGEVRERLEEDELRRVSTMMMVVEGSGSGPCSSLIQRSEDRQRERRE